MRIKNLFLLPCILAMTACSSDEQMPDSTPNITSGESYIKINILSSGAPEADTRAGEFADGEPFESDVKSVILLFFDKDGNIVDNQSPTVSNDTFVPVDDTNSSLSKVGTIEVALKNGLDYSQVIAVLNPFLSNSDDNVGGTGSVENVTSISSLYNDGPNYFFKNYTAHKLGSTQIFTMSNSIYYKTAQLSEKPSNSSTIAIASPISGESIYYKDSKGDPIKYKEDGTSESAANAPYVDIYVERVIAKVSVKNDIDLSQYKAEEESAQLSVFNKDGGAQDSKKKIDICPVIKGMALNVTSKYAHLLKNVSDLSNFGYEQTENGWHGFQWNDPENHRSYWANIPGDGSISKANHNYLAWNKLTETPKKGASMDYYINPNNCDYSTITTDDSKSHTTKLTVAAQLYYKTDLDADGQPKAGAKPVELVEYSGMKYLYDDFLTIITADINKSLAGVAANPESKKTISPSAVLFESFNSTKENETGAREQAWRAKLSINAEDEVVKALSDAEKQAVNSVIAHYNTYVIKYWKDGMCYYYVPIRHQGFTGLTGDETKKDYVFAVIRNHWYNVTLTGIVGIGTPVIDPEDPIDPNRPSGDPAYLKARIYMLDWRVVNQSLTIK